MSRQFVNIRVEFKPLLASANIFIEFSRDLISIDVRVIVEKTTISIKAESFDTDFSLQGVFLKPETCRGLRWIGSQELQLTLEAHWVGEECANGIAEDQKLPGGYQHIINQDALVTKIQTCQSQCFCVGCGAQIFKPSCNFRRVLPLPSENWSDFADIWFCHNHDHSGGESKDDVDSNSHEPSCSSTSGVSKDRDLLPRPDDCLVSSLYMLVSSAHVKLCAVGSHHGKLICRRCGNFLGFVKGEKTSEMFAQASNSSDVYKLYFHAVCFKPDLTNCDKNLIPKPLIPPTLNNNSHGNLLSDQSIEAFLCHLLRDQSHRFTSFRFIVDSDFQSDGQSGVCILLWLLDQDLHVFSTSSSSLSSSTYKTCTSCKNMKLLYKADFTSTTGHLNCPGVFRMWRNDNTVHGMSLPYPLCKQLLATLISTTRKLSQSQRSLNGFHVGYLSSS